MREMLPRHRAGRLVRRHDHADAYIVFGLFVAHIGAGVVGGGGHIRRAGNRSRTGNSQRSAGLSTGYNLSSLTLAPPRVR